MTDAVEFTAFIVFIGGAGVAAFIAVGAVMARIATMVMLSIMRCAINIDNERKI